MKDLFWRGMAWPRPIVTTAVAAVVVLLAVIPLWIFVFANGDGESYKYPADDPQFNPTQTEHLHTTDCFFAELPYRDFVKQANLFRMKVKVQPADKWPGTKFSNDTIADQTTQYLMVRVRGINVPREATYIRWYRPDHEIQRHLKRLDAANDYAWQILRKTDVICLTNPKIETGDMVCDMQLELAGTMIDFAKMIVDAGYAKPGEMEWDWGKRDPKPQYNNNQTGE